MKTLVLIACLFGVVYCVNRQVLENWHSDVTKCTQEISKPPTDPDTIYCVLGKQNLLDQGKYLLDKGLEMFDDIISDDAKRNQAKEIVRNCYNSFGYIADKPETNADQTKKGVPCSLPAIAMIDPL